METGFSLSGRWQGEEMGEKAWVRMKSGELSSFAASSPFSFPTGQSFRAKRPSILGTIYLRPLGQETIRDIRLRELGQGQGSQEVVELCLKHKSSGAKT